MNKKTLSTLAMAVSALIVLFGILTLAGAMGGDTYIASSAPWSYDSGYATFGGDFYTYVSNNAAEAADGAYTAANNLDDIALLLKNVFGVFLMGFGLLGLCFFGILRADAAKEAAAEPAAEPVTAEAVCEEPAMSFAVPVEEAEAPAEAAEVPAEEPEAAETPDLPAEDPAQ